MPAFSIAALALKSASMRAPGLLRHMVSSRSRAA